MTRPRPWWLRRPRLGVRPPPPRGVPPPAGLTLGHRGGRAHAPDNSLEAIVAAHERGADGVELDVRMRGTGLVCAHDPGQPGPPLRAALDLAASLGLWVELDLKSGGRDGAVQEVLREIDGRDRIWISTFHPYAAWRLRWADPSVVVGWAMLPDRAARPLLWTPWVLWLGALVVEPHVSLVRPWRLERWRSHGLQVVAWGVQPHEAPRLRARGISVVMDDLAAPTPPGSRDV